MYQKLWKLSDGDVEFRVDFAKEDSIPFKIWDNETTSLFLSLTLKEAEQLCDKLGFAIQDYKRSLENERK